MSTRPIKAGPVQEEWPGCVGSWTSPGFPRAGTEVWDAAPGTPGPCALTCVSGHPDEDEGWGVRVVVRAGSHTGEDAAGPGDPPQTHVALSPATSWKWGRNDQGLISFLFSTGQWPQNARPSEPVVVPGQSRSPCPTGLRPAHLCASSPLPAGLPCQLHHVCARVGPSSWSRLGPVCVGVEEGHTGGTCVVSRCGLMSACDKWPTS